MVLALSGGAMPATADDSVLPSSPKRFPELLPFVERNELAGAVALVANKDAILVEEAIGFADIDRKKPMQIDSIFWIASQSKPITAAAVMILVDEGKIQLDDPVEKYLPEFAHVLVSIEKDAAHQLLQPPNVKPTIRNLLNHTSGLPFKSNLEEPTLDLFPLRARVLSYAMTPLDFEPNTRYQYSNAGINTAARIIEVVSGKKFEDFLDQRLFQPLEMRDTTFWPSDEQTARIAHAYRPGPENQGLVETKIEQLFYPLTNRIERFPMPAGGLFATAQDLTHFYQMLLRQGEWRGKRVLSESAVHELTKRQTPIEMKESYGLGFSCGGSTFGHGGAYSTNTIADFDRDEILVWLVQHAGFPGKGGEAQQVFQQSARLFESQRDRK